MTEKLKNMTWPKVAALIVMLIGATLSSQGIIDPEEYQDFQELSWSIAEQAVLDYLEPRINPSIYVTARDYKFVTIDVEDYAVLFNGSSNKIIGWAQNDDGLVGNWMLGNLTSGRSWMERVAYIGNFTITETQNPGNFTEIHILGVLKAQASLDDAIFERTSAGEHISIIGGEIDGNLANQGTPDVGRGIELENVDDIRIEGTWIHDTKGEAVRLKDGERAQLDYTADNTEGSILTLYGFEEAQGSIVGHTTTDDPMYQIIQGSKNNVLDLSGEDGSEDGITIDGETSAHTRGNHITGTIEDVEDNGLEFLSYAYDNSVEIRVEDPADYGAYFADLADNNTLHDGSINGWDSVQDGVYMAGAGNRLINNKIYNFTEAGKYGVNEIAGSDGNVYIGNDLTGNTAAVNRNDQTATWIGNKGTWDTTAESNYLIRTESSRFFLINGDTDSLAGISSDADDVFTWADGNITTSGKIIVLNGEYPLDTWAPTNRLNLIGQDAEQTILNITSTEVVTWNGDMIVESFKIMSKVDGFYHITLKGDTTLRDNTFDFPLSMSGELTTIFRSSATTPNTVKFLNNHLLQGGEAGANYWGLFKAVTDIDTLKVQDFTADHIIANGTNGRIGVFVIDSVAIDDGIFENILIKLVSTKFQGSAFIYTGTTGTVGRIRIENYRFLDGNWIAATSYFSVIDTHNLAELITLEGIYQNERFHPVLRAQKVIINDYTAIGDGVGAASLDHGTLDDVNGSVTTLSNIIGVNHSIDMNTGWEHMTIDGFSFSNSRVTVLDEGDAQYDGQPKYVVVGNGNWRYDELGQWSNAFLLSYAQGLYLAELIVHDINFFGIRTIFSVSTSSYPTKIIVDNINTGPKIDSQYPRLFEPDGGARNNDNQMIWISDSEITTYLPPLKSWNPIRPNDKFDNVVWNNTHMGQIYYSEVSYNWTISSGNENVTINHDLPTVGSLIPRGPTSTFAVTLTSDAANATGVYVDWSEFTNTQITVTAYDSGARTEVDDDVTGTIIIWLTKPSP